MTKLTYQTLPLIILGVLLFLPSLAAAATAHLETKHQDIYVGDNIIFSVRLDPEGQSLNAVEGKVILDYEPKSVSIGEINVAGSAFTLWPRKPSLATNEKEISFVAGVPNGLKTKDALLFNLVLNLSAPGRLTLQPNGLIAYLNDGQGTKVAVAGQALELEVLPAPDNWVPRQEWLDITLTDKTPPERFEILLGQDNSVFEGRKFISFNAVDKATGVDYYEVKEGDLPPVRSGETYILQEQDSVSKIVVTAFDVAGNTRSVTYSPPVGKLWLILIGLILALVVGITVFIKRKHVPELK